MSDLVAIVFGDETTAFEVRTELVRMQKEYLIELDDVVIVTKDADGNTTLHQAGDLTAEGSLGGGFWEMLIGLLFLNPMLGATGGTASGDLAGRLTDIGIDDKMMKELAETFTPGAAALFVLVKKGPADKVLERLRPLAGNGTVFKTSLNKDDEESLQQLLESL